MRLLWSVDHGLRSYSKQMARNVGVTSPQRLVIRMVGRYPGVSAGKLADLLHVHPSTLTGVLDRLVKRGLLERHGDPDDGRRALFELTNRGGHIDELRIGTVEDVVRRVMSRLSENKLDATAHALAELARELAEPPARGAKAAPKRKVRKTKSKER